MTRQSRKTSASKVAQFELKRMEILRYHQDLPSRTDGSLWFWMLIMLLFSANPTFAPEIPFGNEKEDKPDKEE